LGYHPEIILAGRRFWNDSKGEYVVLKLLGWMIKKEF
jgi:hypothetical protein